MSNASLHTGEIHIVLNGSALPIPGAMTLAGLLDFLGIARDRVAIELDGTIVRKQDWPATLIASGSSVEIVQFVGGG